MYRIDDGAPAPLGATFDGKGVNFALFSAHASAVDLCLFDPQGRRELERVAPAAPHRPGLARLSRRPRARPALRLPRARPLRSAARPPLQPAQAAHRSVCPPDLRAHPLARRAVRLPHGRPARRPHPRPPRQRADDAEMRRRGSVAIIGATTGRRATAATDTIIYEAHVKGLDGVAPGRARGSARHL